jgi:hypothetical protein
VTGAVAGQVDDEQGHVVGIALGADGLLLGHFPVCSKICRPRGWSRSFWWPRSGAIAFDVTLYLAIPLAVDQEKPMMPALAAP